MFIIKSISNAFNKFRNKVSKPDANSSDKKSSKDDCSTSGSVMSPGGDRQFHHWQSSNEEEQRAKSQRQTWEEVYPSLSSYREENIHAHRVSSSEPAPQSRRTPTHSSWDTVTRTSLELSSRQDSARPKRSSTAPEPELTPQRAYSSFRASAGPSCPRPVVSTAAPPVVLSSREYAQARPVVSAAAPQVVLSSREYAQARPIVSAAAPQVVLSSREYAQARPIVSAAAPQVVLSSREYAQARPVVSAAVPQVKPQSFGLGHNGHVQPRHEESLARHSSLQRDRCIPSAIQAARRSSASELLPEENRVPQLQLQALNKHINSYYERNLRSYSEDYLDVELSAYRNACLPYRPDQVNIWFRELVRRAPTAEPEGTPLGAHVDMINLIKTDDSKTMIEAIKKFRTIRLEDGEELYFHATDARSAKSIIEQGIDISQTRSKEDFSNGYGFYVTPDYAKSVDWADRKGDKYCHNTGAIIAFKVSRQLQKEKLHLVLEVRTAEGRRNWQKTVSHFRNGEAIGSLSVMLQNVKFIRGPVSRNAFLRPGEIPVPYENFTQICICDEEYAERYGSLSNICFVIFFKVN